MNQILDQSFKPKNVIKPIIGDRFIPRRKDSNFDLISLQEVFANNSTKNDGKDALDDFLNHVEHLKCRNSTITRYYKNNYKTMLYKTISEADLLNQKIFVYSKKSKNGVKMRFNNKEAHWPVLPRSKPVIGKPIAILDMPELDTMLSKNTLDWSSTSYFAMIFQQNVIIWNPNENDRVIMPNLSARNCLKWHPGGKLLYVSTCQNLEAVGHVRIIDCDKHQIVDTLKCSCSMGCSITAIEFHRYLILGCSRGSLTLYEDDKIRRCKKLLYGRILTLKASCRGTYLAVSCINGFVRIFYLSTLTELFEFNFNLPTKCISWHPNKDYLMAIANKAHIILCNFNQEVEVITYQKILQQDSQEVTIDALTFNPLSAELVVCFHSNVATSMIVLRDFDTAVEEVFFHLFRVAYIMWNKNGTELATADAGETLCIWKFFGTAENEKLILQRRNSCELSPLITKKYDPITWSKKLNMFTSHHIR